MDRVFLINNTSEKLERAENQTHNSDCVDYDFGFSVHPVDSNQFLNVQSTPDKLPSHIQAISTASRK